MQTRTPRWPSRCRRSWPPGGYVSDDDHQRDRRRAAGPAATARRASCSTATRGPCSRSTPSTACSPRPASRSTPSSRWRPTPTRSWRGCSSGPRPTAGPTTTQTTIRTRQQVYADQTAPLLEVYRDRGLLVEVDGLGEVDEVSERVFAALDAARRQRQRPRRRSLLDHASCPRRPAVEVKTPDQLRLMRRAGLVVAQTLDAVAAEVRPGVTTRRARRGRGRDVIAPAGAEPVVPRLRRRRRTGPASRGRLPLGRRRGRPRRAR